MNRTVRYLFNVLSVIVLVGSTAASHAAIIDVPGDEPTIKRGIVVAEEGDTILVASGTYSGEENRDLEFGGKAIILRSIKGPTATVINCGGTPEEPHRAFYIHQDEDSRTVIAGFTIMNGYAPIVNPDNRSYGGGILCIGGSSPQILDCVFYNNTAADAGGGMCVLNGSEPYVAECDFIDNTAIDDAHIVPGYGGGVRCHNAAPTFSDCAFSSNRANIGGGISCNNGDVVLDACEFSNNTADVYVTFEPAAAGAGGGAHFFQSSPSLSNCVFDRNIAVYGFNMSMDDAKGGGVAAFESSLSIDQCTFYGNIAERYGDQVPGLGAGICLVETDAIVQNCLIAFNSGGEGISCTSCSVPALVPQLLCCDIYGNELGDWIGDIADQLGQQGNISADPLFCDTVIGNLYLNEHSPCAPDNSLCPGLIGSFGVGCTTDIDGHVEIPDQPRELTLFQNHPNPFNQATTIYFELSAASEIQLILYDVRGCPVRQLAGGVFPAGTHRVTWDGLDGSGRHLASGIYVYSLNGETMRQTRKMVLLK